MGKMGKKHPTALEQAREELGGDYTPIDPRHNAIRLILADLGKGDLNPSEVEALCGTVKVPGVDGFTRLDQLPCGCERIYRGNILGAERHPDGLTIRIGGLEGAKPCPKHAGLVDRVRLQGLPGEQPKLF